MPVIENGAPAAVSQPVAINIGGLPVVTGAAANGHTGKIFDDDAARHFDLLRISDNVSDVLSSSQGYFPAQMSSLKELNDAQTLDQVRSEGFDLHLRQSHHSTTDVDGYDEDDGDAQQLSPHDQLVFRDTKYKETALSRLHTMRRNRELCDVIFLVQNREVYAHKSVLAAASPYFYELFTGTGIHCGQDRSPSSASSGSQQASNSGPQQQQTNNNHNSNNGLSPAITVNINNPENKSYFEFVDSDFDTFLALVNYAYTSCLEVGPDKVKNIYRLASLLRVQSCAKVCAKYLAARLNPENCIGIRSCANLTNDLMLASRVDEYIQQNVQLIVQRCRDFLALPLIQVSIVLSDDSHELFSTQLRDERLLGEKILSHMERLKETMPESREFRMDILTEKEHLLYLHEDNTLHDCYDADENSSVGASELIQDYKKVTKKSIQHAAVTQKAAAGNGIGGKRTTPRISTPASGAGRYSSSESLASSLAEEIGWKMIAIAKNSDNFFVCLAVLDRTLATISVHINTSVKTAERRDCSDSPSHESTASSTDLDQKMRRTSEDPIMANAVSSGDLKLAQADIVPLAMMQIHRASVGAVNLDGKLLVCGGYDRGECLSSVEIYDPNQNMWSFVRKMNKERGRFDATNNNGIIYALGGSDGSRDLASCEKYDPKLDTWTKFTSLPEARSNAACSSMNGIVYSIGGYNGQNGIRDCLMYDPADDTWSPICPLSQTRSQAAVAHWNGKLYCVGGTDNWRCMASAEVYDPNLNEWSALPPMGLARRGCGIAVLKDNLYVVGGHDGEKCLYSVEILDLHAPHNGWRRGPSLNTARANTQAVNLGNQIFVVGGFGKTFLSTIEFLDLESNEWRTFLPAEST